jgi:hypothetical protein
VKAMLTAKEYRRLATRLREKAMAEANRIIRAECIAAAVEYEQMAEEIDGKKDRLRSSRPAWPSRA